MNKKVEIKVYVVNEPSEQALKNFAMELLRQAKQHINHTKLH